LHDHTHNHSESTKNIGIALFLNLAFAIAEIFIGLWTNSLAVLSNSLHDFGDSFSLGLSLYFDKISKKNKSDVYTYGFKRFSIIPVIINSLILLSGSLYILYEAIVRIITPQTTRADGIILFALAGMTINLIAYIRLKKGRTLNERAASLHLLDDVMGLFSVLVVSVIMKYYNVPILDPILSVMITLFVLSKIFQNLKSAKLIFLQAIPVDINVRKLGDKLAQIDGVISIHDLHAWSLDGENHILTVHLVTKDELSIKQVTSIKCEAKKTIIDAGINHPTIEIETRNELCDLSDCLTIR